MIQTRPPALLELPLSLLSRLLLCDPGRFVPRLTMASGTPPRDPDVFFCPPSGDSRQPTPTTPRVDPLSSAPRTASSLLGALLQADALWDAAAELLVMLAQVARGSSPGPRLRLDAPVLHQALAHPHDRVRAAACSLLGSLNPFSPVGPPALGPGVFRELTDGLRDPCAPVRRTACRAVGNWLGFIREAGLDVGGGGERSGVDVESGSTAEEASSAALRHRGEPQEGSGWAEELTRTAPLLLSLVTDPDALTRRHSCAALGNLGGVHCGSTPGTAEVAGAGEVDALRLLLAAACTDPNSEVRRTAIATLSAYSQREAQWRVIGPHVIDAMPV